MLAITFIAVECLIRNVPETKTRKTISLTARNDVWSLTTGLKHQFKFPCGKRTSDSKNMTTDGMCTGIPTGKPTGIPTGIPTGKPTGKPAGNQPGYQPGYQQGNQQGYQQRYQQRYRPGYQRGTNRGTNRDTNRDTKQDTNRDANRVIINIWCMRVMYHPMTTPLSTHIIY